MRLRTGLPSEQARFRALGLVVSLAVSVGCASAGSVATTDPLAGTYFGSGSGAGLEQVRALSKRFSQLHPGVEFKLDDAGSETGIGLVHQNQIDFGYVSREPTADEARKVVLTPLIGTGTAVAVNAAGKAINARQKSDAEQKTSDIAQSIEGASTVVPGL